jgi:hypothetical protein
MRTALISLALAMVGTAIAFGADSKRAFLAELATLAARSPITATERGTKTCEDRELCLFRDHFGNEAIFGECRRLVSAEFSVRQGPVVRARQIHFRIYERDQKPASAAKRKHPVAHRSLPVSAVCQTQTCWSFRAEEKGSNKRHRCVQKLGVA